MSEHQPLPYITVLWKMWFIFLILQLIRIAGLVTGRQRPGTASGVVFLTLEDETGNTNIIIWATVMARFRAALLQGQLLKFKGVVEREGRVIHVVAGHVEDASELL